MFSQLTDVDMKFGALLEENGVEKPLTQSSFGSFLVKRDHDLRKRAFHHSMRSFRITSLPSRRRSPTQSKPTSSAHALETIHPLSKPHSFAMMSDSGLRWSNSAVRANLSPLFRYYELRKRVLGLPELHHYDTYVPLVAKLIQPSHLMRRSRMC